MAIGNTSNDYNDARARAGLDPADDAAAPQPTPAPATATSV
jgi:hypothetical protein